MFSRERLYNLFWDVKNNDDGSYPLTCSIFSGRMAEVVHWKCNKKVKEDGIYILFPLLKAFYSRESDTSSRFILGQAGCNRAIIGRLHFSCYRLTGSG